jgi:hypothetical protein
MEMIILSLKRDLVDSREPSIRSGLEIGRMDKTENRINK